MLTNTNTVYHNDTDRAIEAYTLSDEGYVESVTEGRSIVMDVNNNDELVLPSTVSLSETFTINLIIYKYMWEEINSYDILSCSDGCGFGLSFRNVENVKTLVLSGYSSEGDIYEN